MTHKTGKSPPVLNIKTSKAGIHFKINGDASDTLPINN